MRKLVTLVALVNLFVLVAPVSAQTGPSASVTSPGDGAVLAGSALVAGKGSASVGVARIQLFIEGALVASKEPSDLRQNVDISYTWNTNYFPNTSNLSRNGWYQVLVRVTANGGGGTQEAKRNVRVDNGAAAPTGLSVGTDDRRVTLSWAPNPEPDIHGYRIEADSGGGFDSIGTTTETSYSYTAQPGTYTWRVVALRTSPTSPDGKASEPSATVAAKITRPPAAKAGSGGGANGGSKKVFGGSNKAAKEYIRKTKKQFAARGFGGFASAGISLPGAALGLPRLPDSEVLEWGTYKNKLPYKIPAATGAVAIETTPVNNLAAQSTASVLPMDALRWIAAGILMVVIAMMLQLLAYRAEKKQAQTA